MSAEITKLKQKITKLGNKITLLTIRVEKQQATLEIRNLKLAEQKFDSKEKISKLRKEIQDLRDLKTPRHEDFIELIAEKGRLKNKGTETTP